MQLVPFARPNCSSADGIVRRWYRRGESRGGVSSGSDSHDAFEECVAGLDYPMFVVTVASAGEKAGCLVGFSTQCSIDPVRYGVCISKRNHTAEVAASAEMMAVHVLRPDDEPLARLFGELTADEVAKFDACAWHLGPGQVPVLDRCDWFAGRIGQRVDVGDHVLHVLDVIDAGEASRTASGQLGFQAVRAFEAGHDA
jgi:flavin reductase (DIM6/NTAB) family NADH-FMN oxidoreductase RutF